MPRWNFATIRKSDTGGLGRLNITIAADASQQSLKIHIGKAQDIGAAPGAENGKGLHVECRVQIRPHDDDLAVFDKLIATKPKNGKLQRKTNKHFATSNPLFNEDFLFVLNKIWHELDDYRLYIALVAKENVCSDGTGFLGCMSFSLQEVYSKRGPWPEWWWMLPQSSGFLAHQHVDKAVTEDPSIAKEQVVISGRSRANMQINGLYVCVAETYHERQVYKHRGNGLYLYFHGGRKAWAVSDSLGSSSPTAYCPSDCPTPDQTQVTWLVFSRERQFQLKKGKSTKAVRAEFVQDKMVTCNVATAADFVEYAAVDDAPVFDSSGGNATAMLPKKREVDFFTGRSADPSFVPGTKPLTVKAQNIVRWIRSQQGFVESLRAFELCRSELFRVSSQHPVFASIAKLRAVSEYFIDQLLTAQAKDPDYDLPLGMLLMDIVPILAKPFVTFCTALDVKTNQLAALQTTENLARYKTSSDQVRAAVGRVGGLEKLNTALQAPLLQIQRYPFYCMATMAACEPGDPDAETLLQAAEWYKKLAAQCVAVSGSVSPNTKLPPVPVLTVSGHYVNYFYHGRITRSSAQQMFVDDGMSNGWFLIRKDKCNKSNFFLSYGLNHVLKHCPIAYTDGKFVIAGQTFETMLDLVRYFAVRRVQIKTILTYPRLRRSGDVEEEPETDWASSLAVFDAAAKDGNAEATDSALQVEEDAKRKADEAEKVAEQESIRAAYDKAQAIEDAKLLEASAAAAVVDLPPKEDVDTNVNEKEEKEKEEKEKKRLAKIAADKEQRDAAMRIGMRSELMAVLGKWFASLDEDGSGSLTHAEVKEGFKRKDIHDALAMYIHEVAPEFDGDGDGEISADELIKFADANNDGAITPVELYRALGLFGDHKKRKQPSKDEDPMLSPELVLHVKLLFADADIEAGPAHPGFHTKKPDGFLNSTELETRLNIRSLETLLRRVPAAFKHFDLDNSGTLEMSELIKVMDTNGDGLISMQEFCDAVLGALKQAHTDAEAAAASASTEAEKKAPTVGDTSL